MTETTKRHVVNLIRSADGKKAQMATITRIDLPLSVLAVTITDELFGDTSLNAIGRDQIAAAIDARKLGLDQFAREDLIGLVCRRVVNRAMRA